MGSKTPSTNGRNGDGGDGRDRKTGRFQPGWKGGPGNPRAREVARLREALLAVVTPERLKIVVASIIKLAMEESTPHAVRLAALVELLDRTLGKPVVSDLTDQVESLHQRLDALGKLLTEDRL